MAVHDDLASSTGPGPFECRSTPGGLPGASAATANAPVKVLLVEVDADYAAHIASEFRRGDLVVIQARNLAEARAVLYPGKAPVDVVVCGLHLPDGRGEALLSDIQACTPPPAAIFTSEFLPDAKAAYRLVALPKRVSPATLLHTVKTALGGDTQQEIHRFVTRFKLTKREAEATALLVQGMRAKEIADRMTCSEKMIYAHLARVSKKCGCRDYHEVVCLLLAFTCRAPRTSSPEPTPVLPPRGVPAPRR